MLFGTSIMKKRIAALFFTFCLLATLALSVSADPGAPQAYLFTPTALPDGRIIYKVQAGDTCTGVSLRMGVSIDQISNLNNIRGECSLVAGQDLLLGTVEVSPTPSGPTATPEPLVPTPTPLPGFGEVCVQLFDDLNGNALHEETEVDIAGGAVSLSDRAGEVSLTGSTIADEPLCFTDIPEGEYTISMAAPEGYNATTRTTYTLGMKAGDQVVVDFGAQMSTAAQPVAPSEGGRTPMLGLIGGAVLLIGAGLGIFARFVLKR